MTLTRNKSLDKSRAFSNRRTTPLDGLQERPAAMPNPAQGAEASDTVAQIKKLMQQLPEKQRLVMHLRDVEEHTYEEIAEIVGCPMKTAQSRVRLAHQKLAETLDEKHVMELMGTERNS